MLRILLTAILTAVSATAGYSADESWVVYKPTKSDPSAKKIVLVSGDEEYRSEEALPQLGKILTKHHGFHCTVLFAIDPKDGTINPKVNNNIPGLETLKDADLMIIFTRFRNLPDDQLKHVADYLATGKPIIGLRTATHAFNLGGKSAYPQYHWQSKVAGWDGGFGRKILGETWISHHGAHGSQATRGIIPEDQKNNPILKGIADGEIFGPTDVYGVKLPLPEDSKPVVLGQVVSGMKKEDKALEGKKNDPMMPVAWTKTYTAESGKKGRVFTTTMGASQDLDNEAMRRLLVNATYWCLGMEEKIPAKATVDIVGTYKATPFKFDGHVRNLKPADHAMKE